MELVWFDHLFFCLIGLIIPIMSIMAEKPDDLEDSDMAIKLELPPKKHIYYTNGLVLCIGALLVLTLWNLTYRSFELLGISHPIIDNKVIIGIVIICVIYIVDSIYSYIQTVKSKYESSSGKNLEEIMPTSWNDYKHFIFLAFAAGICEEIVFRGFLVNYIQQIFAYSGYSTFLSLVLPALVFSVSHIYQGWFAVMKIFSISLMFGVIYIFSKSLLIVIIIHVLVDLISGALMVKAAKSKS